MDAEQTTAVATTAKKDAKDEEVNNLLSPLKKTNLCLFDHCFKAMPSYTLSISHIHNQYNTNIISSGNVVIMHIINNTA